MTRWIFSSCPSCRWGPLRMAACLSSPAGPRECCAPLSFPGARTTSASRGHPRSWRYARWRRWGAGANATSFPGEKRGSKVTPSTARAGRQCSPTARRFSSAPSFGGEGSPCRGRSSHPSWAPRRARREAARLMFTFPRFAGACAPSPRVRGGSSSAYAAQATWCRESPGARVSSGPCRVSARARSTRAPRGTSPRSGDRTATRRAA